LLNLPPVSPFMLPSSPCRPLLPQSELRPRHRCPPSPPTAHLLNPISQPISHHRASPSRRQALPRLLPMAQAFPPRHPLTAALAVPREDRFTSSSLQPVASMYVVPRPGPTLLSSSSRTNSFRETRQRRQTKRSRAWLPTSLGILPRRPYRR
jgi:hypothetical protein